MILDLFKELFAVWLEMWELLKEYIPKLFILILWIISGIIILPCVYVSAVFYPKWTDWGEKL